MADEKYIVPDNPVYDPEIRAIQDEDPVKASEVLTPVMEQIIENIHAVHFAAKAAGASAAQAVSVAEKGAPNGVATLDGDGKVPAAQMPDMDYDVAGSAEAVKTALDEHAQNEENPHKVTKAKVGLGNVDNTSDLDKPVSTAQQAAINAVGDAARAAQNTAGAAYTLAQEAKNISTIVYTVEVSTDSWETATTGYAKTIAISGITKNTVPIMDVILSDDVATAKLQLEAFSCISRFITDENSITIFCYDSKPSVNFSVQLVLGGGY